MFAERLHFVEFCGILVLFTHPKVFSLDEAIEFIQDDELIEITPKSIRLRKNGSYVGTNRAGIWNDG